MYLVSPETAAASALTGFITDPTTLPPIAQPQQPDRFRINDDGIIAPLPAAEAEAAEVLRGPNIKPFPETSTLDDHIEAAVILKVGDNITTDHIMPAGSKVLPYRSNIPKISEFCFSVVDETFAARAKAAGKGFIVGGSNYGQGSSREHAALAPLYLGIKAVIAKSFARIHAANLVNAGILPLIFENPDDYDQVEQGDMLRLENVRAALGENRIILHAGDKKIPLRMELAERQKEVLLAGGLLDYAALGN